MRGFYMISFSFIVLFHNNNATDCVIDSIISQSIPEDEIIVVDDHSLSENLHMFDRFEGMIQMVHSDRCGNRGYNRNFGASFAKNNYLLFVDGDIVFLPNAIMSMRESMEKGNVGAVGNVIRSGNTLQQMELITGIDYLNMIKKDLGIEKIIKLNLLSDDRQQLVYDKIALDSVWEYFYSAYCAVPKQIFEEIGGFETRFIGWGVEDDEFGYRLHLKGKLDYNMSAYAIHAPHMRDLYQCLMSNRVNLYRFLAKFPSNKISLHMTFGNAIKIHLAIKYIRTSLIEAGTYIFDFPNQKNCICVNELTSDYPEGYVRFKGKNCETHILELFGMALPFKNNNFEIAYCSENLFIYPEAFCAAILSEMLRVAREIRIIKVQNPKRIFWNSEQISGLKYVSTSGRIVYFPTKICDFDIIEYNNYYKICDGIASKMNEHFYINENYYHPELFETKQAHYILINLTEQKLTSEEKSVLMDKYNIIIDTCYFVPVKFENKEIHLTDVLYGDLYRLHTRMAYLIPDDCQIIKDDKWWNFSFRENDLIIQKM